MSNISSAEMPLSSEEIHVNFLKHPVFIFAGKMSDEQKRHVPNHRHDSYTEVMYIGSGEDTFYIDNKKYTAREGDIIIFNRGLHHEEFYNSDSSIETFYCGMGNVSIEGFNEMWITPHYIEPVFNALSYGDRIKNLMAELYYEGCTRTTGYNHICNNLLANLVVLIIRIINEQFSILRPSSNTNPLLLLTKKIKEYINSNCLRSISLEELANEFHVSLYYLSHVFKKETGSTPMQYHISRRMDEAKRLLLTTEMSVQEIAIRIGYENPNHFYLPFKKATGNSPEKYRNALRNSVLTFDK